jgi:hypothetical protein
MEKEFNNEFHLRIAISHAIAGGLFYDMEIEKIVCIVKEVADEYQEKWEEIKD